MPKPGTVWSARSNNCAKFLCGLTIVKLWRCLGSRAPLVTSDGLDLSTVSVHGGEGHSGTRGRVQWWRFAISVALSLVLAAFVDVVIHHLHEAGYTKSLDDLGADVYIRIHKSLGAEAEGRPFVLIDIDDETYSRWQEPLQTPRDKLAGLIRFAAEAGAALVVVDVDLSRRTAGSETYPELAEKDRILSDTLTALSVPTGGATGSDRAAVAPVPIILQREIRLGHGGANRGIRALRPSFLDPVVEQAPNLHWGATLFEQSSDAIVRRWVLWVAACSAGTVEIVPNVQLLAHSLLAEGQAGAEKVRTALEPSAAGDCGASVERGEAPMLRVGDKDINLSPGDLERRIIYSIPWDWDSRLGGPMVSFMGVRTPALSRLPAYLITENSDTVSPDLLKGRIVIIGGSFEDSRDVLQTPIGPMPGAAVVANAIRSIQVYGPLHHPKGIQKWGLVIGQLLLIGLAFHFLSPTTASLVSVILVVPAIFLLSTLWIQSGVWVDSTLASLTIVVHRRLELMKHGTEHAIAEVKSRRGKGKGAK